MKLINLDPRTKLFLILLCVLSAMSAPNLYFQFVLVTLIGLLAVFYGNGSMLCAQLLSMR